MKSSQAEAKAYCADLRVMATVKTSTGAFKQEEFRPFDTDENVVKMTKFINRIRSEVAEQMAESAYEDIRKSGLLSSDGTVLSGLKEAIMPHFEEGASIVGGNE